MCDTLKDDLSVASPVKVAVVLPSTAPSVIVVELIALTFTFVISVFHAVHLNLRMILDHRRRMDD